MARVRNAPPALNSFIGRTRELDEIGRLLTSARMVTIVGPGGSGKTRLALEVAAMLAPRYPGSAWLVELASVERAAALTPDAHAIDAIVRICSHLDGLPLAIELAAARVGSVALVEIANRLESGLSALGRGSRTAPTRQQTLAATLDWSYTSLTERERRMFRSLAVFPMPFDLEAADWVSRESGAVPDDDGGALDTLAALVDKSLVTIDESAAVARYRLLEPLRQYAEERLKECEERHLALRKRFDWSLTIAERANADLWGSSHATAVAVLEAAYPALRAALEWQLRSEGDTQAVA
jgi:predicted ATPase